MSGRKYDKNGSGQSDGPPVNRKSHQLRAAKHVKRSKIDGNGTSTGSQSIEADEHGSDEKEAKKQKYLDRVRCIRNKHSGDPTLSAKDGQHGKKRNNKNSTAKRLKNFCRFLFALRLKKKRISQIEDPSLPRQAAFGAVI
jgi:hypothetical protein